MPKGFSIHLGLNEIDSSQYEGWSGHLSGAELDAKAMAALASSNGLHSKVLLGPDATASNFIDALREIFKRCRANDLLVISFAGHGSSMSDPIHEALDKTCKTWCLWDRQFFARELYWYIHMVPCAGRIILITDCCWSGTVIRASQRNSHENVRMAPSGVSIRCNTSAKPSKEVLERISQKNILGQISASFLVIQGCQDNQLAMETAAGGKFTNMLLSTWEDVRDDAKVNYSSFVNKIRVELPPTQTPSLSSWGRDKNLIESFISQRPFQV